MPSLPSYAEAIEIIRARTRPLGRVTSLTMHEAAGLAVATPLFADQPYPRFDNSAVDGYAVGAAVDARAGVRLVLAGSTAAGEQSGESIQPGTARRILTGAPVPPGAYGVAMQEDVEVQDGHLYLREGVEERENIRLQGSEILPGQELVALGTQVNPGVAALFALAGQTSADVFQAPSVAVLTTGDELVDVSATPIGSQIRDTNSVMLDLLVRQATGFGPSLKRVPDDLSRMIWALEEASRESDLILVAGGASVGDRDFVAEAVSRLGEIYFHGVAIRPGKPILFGKIGRSLVFGLPGNPTSVFVGFHIFVRFAIRILSGLHSPDLVWTPMETGFVHRAAGRADFPRVQFKDGRIVVAKEQGSFGLTSSAYADAIAMFPPDVETPVGFRCPTLRLHSHRL